MRCARARIATAGAAIVLGACGRLSFESRRTGDAAGASEDASADASACPGGDGVCLYPCADVDPDCVTTCGDTRCVGNAGELCATCAPDCATMAIACGNGACEVGENPDCYADCGPSPWPPAWTVEEQALVDELNLARTTGVTCPGDTMPRTAAVLALDLSFQAGPREVAWEVAHQGFAMSNGDACNGRTLAQRFSYFGYNAQGHTVGATTPQAAVAYWLGATNLCPLMMSTTRTKIAPAAAHDLGTSFVVGLK